MTAKCGQHRSVRQGEPAIEPDQLLADRRAIALRQSLHLIVPLFATALLTQPIHQLIFSAMRIIALRARTLPGDFICCRPYTALPTKLHAPIEAHCRAPANRAGKYLSPGHITHIALDHTILQRVKTDHHQPPTNAQHIQRAGQQVLQVFQFTVDLDANSLE